MTIEIWYLIFVLLFMYEKTLTTSAFLSMRTCLISNVKYYDIWWAVNAHEIRLSEKEYPSPGWRKADCCMV